MINFDPKLVDQDAIRKAKRKKYLKIAIFPCVVLLFFALLAGRQSVYNLFFGIAIRSDDMGFANALTQFQLFSNFAEPYIAHYNEGIVRIANKHYEDAEKSFRTSLDNNPPEKLLCDIYNNLAYSIEMQGDMFYKSSTYDKAIDAYTRAESILVSSGCATRNEEEKKEDNKDENNNAKGDSSSRSKAQDTIERISEKRKRAVESQNEMANTGGDNGESGNAIDEETLREMLEQNSANNRQGASFLQPGGKGGGYGGDHYRTTETPW